MIHAVRHFVTPWNEAGLLQGLSDISLIEDSKENEALAVQVQQLLAPLSIDKVFVSPLKRAIETAQLLNITNYTKEPLVGEMSFGRFEGKPKIEMISAFAGKWETDPMSTKLQPELRELQPRIEQFLDGLDKDKEYLIVSHGAYIRAMKSMLESGGLKYMNSREFQNGEMLSLEW